MVTAGTEGGGSQSGGRRGPVREAVVVIAPDGIISFWSAGATDFYGWSKEEAIGKHISTFLPDGDQEQQRLLAERVLGGETLPTIEVRRRSRDGEVLDVALTMSPVLNADGEVVAAIALHRDVSGQVYIHMPAGGMWAPVADGLADAVVVLAAVRGEDGRVLDLRYAYANPAAGALAGVETVAMTGSSMLGDHPGPTDRALFAEYCEALESGLPYAAEVPWGRPPDGDESAPQTAWLDVQASRFGDGLLVVSRNTTLRHLTAQLLEAEALADPLTGLANRRLALDRGAQALGRAAREGGEVVVLFVDLDGFKAVNDERGHATGDKVLRAVAGRLERAVRDVDTVARWGGDEFVVICCTGGGSEEVDLVAGRLQAAVDRPLQTSTGTVAVGSSIGVATSRGAPEGPSVAELIRRADLAMYEAKLAPGDSICHYKDLTGSRADTVPAAAAPRARRQEPGGGET